MDQPVLSRADPSAVHHTFRNLTPHAIGLVDEAGTIIIVEPTYPSARLAMTPGAFLERVCGVAVHEQPVFNGIVDLPPRRPGVLLIVSQLTALAVNALHPERDDVVYPAAAFGEGAARDKFGSVLTVKRLIRAN